MHRSSGCVSKRDYGNPRPIVRSCIATIEHRFCGMVETKADLGIVSKYVDASWDVNHVIPGIAARNGGLTSPPWRRS